VVIRQFLVRVLVQLKATRRFNLFLTIWYNLWPPCLRWSHVNGNSAFVFLEISRTLANQREACLLGFQTIPSVEWCYATEFDDLIPAFQMLQVLYGLNHNKIMWTCLLFKSSNGLFDFYAPDPIIWVLPKRSANYTARQYNGIMDGYRAKLQYVANKFSLQTTATIKYRK